MRHWKDQLPGGLADDRVPDDFDPIQLQKGIEVELEHTGDRILATEIAMDHLMEDPIYYTKLEKMEGKRMHRHRNPRGIPKARQARRDELEAWFNQKWERAAEAIDRQERYPSPVGLLNAMQAVYSLHRDVYDISEEKGYPKGQLWWEGHQAVENLKNRLYAVARELEYELRDRD